MTGQPIAILDTSYLFHLARASASLGSTVPVERFLQNYSVYIPQQIRVEMGEEVGRGEVINGASGSNANGGSAGNDHTPMREASHAA